ncbi:2-methylaconitate cis-trans isomerase PrpF family protein [Fusobacterium sp. PH5-44]|uniref:2-methylaconitate cis-trans isomerase PrpF family protein n=1 Tax=unclassified Fusobacterium TaxID=2648384 RepID=UPI003D2147ED
MRGFKTTFMRGGTSKGCMFLREDLPADKSEWDKIFLQVMGSPDPKQIDGMGGTVSSNNKIVIVWKSEKENVDVEYLVGQVIVGKNQIDYKSNCGNMTAAVGPFAAEMGFVDLVEPITTVRLFNCNTNKYINVTVPCENGKISEDGNCKIAGVDGTSPELKVNFLNPVGAKTGKLFPTGNHMDILDIDGIGKIRATVLDISNPMVLVKAEDIGLTGIELPDEINQNNVVCDKLERIRGTAACMMGFAKDLDDAIKNSPAVPKVGVFTKPISFRDIADENVSDKEMDVCVRVMSVFKCHKACPLTSASAISVAAFIEGTLLYEELGKIEGQETVRIGHPSGIMTMYPHIVRNDEEIDVPSVAVQRTARKIMEGTVFVRK